MTDETEVHRNIYSRLEGLSRSQEQDMAVRRLLNGGMVLTTLDTARVVRTSIGESFRKGETHLMFRDRADMRWVIARNGQISVSGRTSWEIIP